MDNNLLKAYNLIADKIEETLKAQNFKRLNVEVEGNREEVTIFKGESLAYSLAYLKDVQQFELSSCQITEEDGIDENWQSISCWLFSPEIDTVRDAMGIAEDFCDTLGGTKRLAAVKQSKKKKKTGDDNVDPLFFMNRLSTIWPEMKDEVQHEKQNYEYFRGVTFAKNRALPRFLATIKNSDKRKIKKLFDLINDSYKLGDLDVRGIITIVFINSIDDESTFSNIQEYLSDELKKSSKYARKIKGKNIKPEKKKKQKQSFISKTLADRG